MPLYGPYDRLREAMDEAVKEAGRSSSRGRTITVKDEHGSCWFDVRVASTVADKSLVDVLMRLETEEGNARPSDG